MNKFHPVDWSKVDYLIAGMTCGWVAHMVFQYIIYEVLRL